MSGRGSPLPDSEKMDLTPPSEERCRLPPNPPLGSDEFLYLQAETIAKIIDLKAKVLADWFRPQGLSPEAAEKFEKIYQANSAEMQTLCDRLGMTYGELPDSIHDLHEKINPIHLRLHGETTPSQKIQQKSPPIQKGKGKRPLDAEGFQAPPKHLVCKNPAETSKDPAPLPTGNPFSLPAHTPLPSNDPAESTTEKTRKLRIPPYFVRPNPNWIVNMSILKREFPSIAAVHARDNFIKLTVNTHSSASPQVNHLNSAHPQGRNQNTTQMLSEDALHLFKILSKFAHDDSLHFPSLLNGIRSALPTLRITKEDDEKAIIIFEHYYTHYCNSR
ncbi:hypothetical protein CDAR_201001 [Caerostris darwini]|uniref:Uncharacterized protein n=1 Tax=Caerostris darwini TaxID=1538125 RepID=A0AAV4QIJ8_9ARAC|nr:hypothetical protein CDAR_201001 [Caerostris darwini]